MIRIAQALACFCRFCRGVLKQKLGHAQSMLPYSWTTPYQARFRTPLMHVRWCHFCGQFNIWDIASTNKHAEIYLRHVILNVLICERCYKEQRIYDWGLIEPDEFDAMSHNFTRHVIKIQKWWKQCKVDRLHRRRHRAARRIQRACHNWLYKPITADGQYGIQLRIGLRQLDAANAK